jgi:hypothetical protein
MLERSTDLNIHFFGTDRFPKNVPNLPIQKWFSSTFIKENAVFIYDEAQYMFSSSNIKKHLIYNILHEADKNNLYPVFSTQKYKKIPKFVRDEIENFFVFRNGASTTRFFLNEIEKPSELTQTITELDRGQYIYINRSDDFMVENYGMVNLPPKSDPKVIWSD